MPVTISGARALLPPKRFPALGWGEIVVTVHPPIETLGMTTTTPNDVDALKVRVAEVITSALRDVDGLKKSE